MEFFLVSENQVEQIRKLARASWLDAYAEILSPEQIEYMLKTMYSQKEILNHIKNPNYQYYFLEVEKHKIGFIGFEYHYEKKTTKLHRLYLLPECQGNGYGKIALNFLKDKVLENQDNRIILNVNKNNVAQKMYEKQGFEIYDEGMFDIDNGFFMDDYLMEFNF